MICLARNIRSFTDSISPMTRCTALFLSRPVFTDHLLGIESFKIARENAKKIAGADTAIQRFENTISSKKILAKDIEDMVLLVKTDSEVDLLIKGLKEYMKQDKQENHHSLFFSGQIMRLLYILNKPDIALNILMSEEESLVPLFTTHSCIIVATKLYNEGRFTDIIKLVDSALVKKFPQTREKTANVDLPENIVTVLTASLCKLGDADALNKFKYYFKHLRSQKSRLSLDSIVHGVLLALKCDDVDFANEVLSILTNPNTSTVNLKLLILARSNLNEAVDLLENSCTAMDNKNKDIRVHRSVINELRKFVEKANNPDFLRRIDALLEDLIARKRVYEKDFEERFTTALTSVRKENDLNYFKFKNTVKNFTSVNKPDNEFDRFQDKFIKY